MFLSSNSFRQACKQQSSYKKTSQRLIRMFIGGSAHRKKTFFFDVHVEKSLPSSQKPKNIKKMVASFYFPDPPIPNPGAPNSADKTDDISRLFIYYVGRKKDQYLGTVSLWWGLGGLLVTISLWRISWQHRPPRRVSQGPLRKIGAR